MFFWHWNRRLIQKFTLYGKYKWWVYTQANFAFEHWNFVVVPFFTEHTQHCKHKPAASQMSNGSSFKTSHRNGLLIGSSSWAGLRMMLPCTHFQEMIIWAVYLENMGVTRPMCQPHSSTTAGLSLPMFITDVAFCWCFMDMSVYTHLAPLTK